MTFLPGKRTAAALGALLLTWSALIAANSAATAAEMEHVRLSDDGKGFVLAESGKRFVPWGFNYDHDGEGRLLEDYWVDEWDRVEQDFGEMRELGTTVVRIHLQTGRFLDDAETPNQAALDRLKMLVALAEKNGLYLDITGLGCYHKQDVPAWYDALDEKERWQAQARFWEAVAATCAESPAVFCYDLMNEPVVPGGGDKRDDWLGPAFAGKHFVQFITLELGERERPDVAREWIETLARAIRRHDRRHLVTVGMVDWSLDRRGLTSGFVPERVSGDLDFLSVHIYPQAGKVDEALETLKGFAAVGKPVVIEETAPLKCSLEEYDRFLTESRERAAGWLSFYWGTTIEEYREGKTLHAAIAGKWLEFFVEKRPALMAADGVER